MVFAEVVGYIPPDRVNVVGAILDTDSFHWRESPWRSPGFQPVGQPTKKVDSLALTASQGETRIIMMTV